MSLNTSESFVFFEYIADLFVNILECLETLRFVGNTSKYSWKLFTWKVPENCLETVQNIGIFHSVQKCSDLFGMISNVLKNWLQESSKKSSQ